MPVPGLLRHVHNSRTFHNPTTQYKYSLTVSIDWSLQCWMPCVCAAATQKALQHPNATLGTHLHSCRSVFNRDKDKRSTHILMGKALSVHLKWQLYNMKSLLVFATSPGLSCNFPALGSLIGIFLHQLVSLRSPRESNIIGKRRKKRRSRSWHVRWY